MNDPARAVAMRDAAKVQVAPHEIPAGELVTTPVPEPVFATRRVGTGVGVQVAPTQDRYT